MATTSNRIVWAALLASIPVYAAVAFAMTGGLGAPLAGRALPLAALFGLTSLSIGAGSIFIRGRALVMPIARGELDPRTAEGARRAFVPFILGLAMSESIAIQGLVIALLSGDARLALPFFVLALVLMFVHRPNAPELRAPSSGSQAQLDSSPIG